MPSFPRDILETLSALRAQLAYRGARGFLMGGAVRDALLGRPIADLDVAVTTDPESAAQALGERLQAPAFPLDPERGIHRVLLSQGRLTIDLTELTADVQQDAQRRDFTVNGLAIDLEDLLDQPQEARVLDPVGGLDDLRHRLVRAISDQVFHEDPGRLLRAVRLAGELGFAIEPRTAELVLREARQVQRVAPERVRDEFCRILDLPGSGRWLRLLDQLGLLTRVLPELETARGVAQPKEHYWDVFEHSIESVAAVERVLRQSAGDHATAQAAWDESLARHFAEEMSGGRSRRVLLKLAALLHDVGKPATKTIEAGGRIRFLGHPRVGAQMARGAMERLRFSNRETQMVVVMVEQHLRPGLICRDEGPTPRALHRFFRDAGDVVVETLYLSLADYLAARGPLVEREDWRAYAEKIRGMLDAWRAQQQSVRPAKLVDGHDLMQALGLEPGPLVGRLLEAVEEARVAGEIKSRDEAIALAARIVRSGPQKAGVSEATET